MDKASPLSIAVAEKDFQTWVSDEVTYGKHRATRQPARPETSGSSFVRNWPKLNSLTFNDLTSQGKEWVDFLGLKSGLQLSYGRANNFVETRKRVDENLARYVVNYLRMTLVMVSCLLCERPESVVGIIVILAIVDWFAQFTAQTRLDKQSTLYQILSLFVTLLVWFVVFLSKAVVSISRSLLLTGIIVLLHASFRLTEALERERLKAYKKLRKQH